MNMQVMRKDSMQNENIKYPVQEPHTRCLLAQEGICPECGEDLDDCYICVECKHDAYSDASMYSF